MGILRDQVHPEGAGRPSAVLRPFVPVVYRTPIDTGGQGQNAPAGPSLFANQEFFNAQCQSTDALGACVYANSTQAFVSTADEGSPDPVIGIIVAKQGDTQCTVQRLGQSAVAFTGLIPGKRYFLGRNGGLLAPPFDDEQPEFVQQVGNAISATRLFIQPTGSVIRRIINKDFVLNLGDGAPQANGKYPRTDIYVQRDAEGGPKAFLSPTLEGEDSVILVGDGPPTSDMPTAAQAIYRDADSNLYFADGSGSVPAGLSAIIFGAGAPTGGEQPSNNVYYLDAGALTAYPRTNVTGAS